MELERELEQKKDRRNLRSHAQQNPFVTTLVVDSQFYFAGFLEDYLEKNGHFILRADTAADALEKARLYQPDLILLDNHLDQLHGLDLLPELLMEQPSALVIMLARDPSFSEAVQAIKKGAVDYLERPLDPQKLKYAIDSHLALYKNGPVDVDVI